MMLFFGFLIIIGLPEKPGFAGNKKIQEHSRKNIREHKNFNTKPLDANDAVAIEKRWGVQLQGINITAAGHMLDFRFRVIDPNKAAHLLDTKHKASVIVEENGIALEVPNVPRIGSLRQNSKQVKQGMVFTVLFGNPGKMVAAGQELTVHIGDFSVEHVKVGEILNYPPKPKKLRKRTVRND
ncbi:MAG: hypothetical protein ABL903_14545 [Methylococcales bacterium]